MRMTNAHGTRDRTSTTPFPELAAAHYFGGAARCALRRACPPQAQRAGGTATVAHCSARARRRQKKIQRASASRAIAVAALSACERITRRVPRRQGARATCKRAVDTTLRGCVKSFRRAP